MQKMKFQRNQYCSLGLNHHVDCVGITKCKIKPEIYCFLNFFFFFSFFVSPGSYRVYCVIGDAESAEGSVWEAMNFASQYKLNNLCAIFDINRLGQSDPTMFEHDLEHYKKKTEAFGYGRSFWDLITYNYDDW